MAEIKVEVCDIKGRKFALRWTDPITGKEKQKSSGTRVRRDAERAAERLQKELNESGGVIPTRLTWDQFCDMYELQKLPNVSSRSRAVWQTSTASLESWELQQTEVAKLVWLHQLDADRISRWHAWLRERGRVSDTIACYTRYIMAALRWAKKSRHLAYVPVVEMEKKTKRKRRRARGRAVTEEEYQQMLAAIPRVHEADECPEWRRLIEGLWLSGLRIGEAVDLSWDDDAELCVDMLGARPKLRMYEDGHKGGEDVTLPITPGFAKFLSLTPERDRIGKVFPIATSYNRAQFGVTDIGRESGVVVDRKKGKFATAHDLRRSFGTRWAMHVKPLVLQKLMRHKSIETTLSYYVDLDADEIGDVIWGLGDVLGDAKPKPKDDASDK